MYRIDIVGGAVYSDEKMIFDFLGASGEIKGDTNRLVLNWENYEDKNSFKIILNNPAVLDYSTLEKPLDTDELVISMPEAEQRDKFINIDESSGYFYILFGSLSLKIQYESLNGEYLESQL